MLRGQIKVQEITVRDSTGWVVQVCEVVSCGDAHPGVSGGCLLLTGLAVLTAGETKGIVDRSVVELGKAW